MSLQLVDDLAVVAFAVACAVFDLRTRRIPNALTFGGMAAGLVIHLVAGGAEGLKSSALALGLNGFVFFLFAAAGGLGGGDVKMMAAVGALFGLQFGLFALLYAALAGGALAIGLALYHKKLGTALRNIARSPLRILKKAEDAPVSGPLYVPYGVAIAAGAIYTVLARRFEVLLIGG